jgi:hypothetical protein
MRNIARRLAIPLIAWLFVAGSANAQTNTSLPLDPVVGVWKLNLEKSKYETPPPKTMTVTITPAARGYTFAIDAIGPDGQPQKWGYTSAFDGAESEVSGNAAIDTVVASSAGTGSTVRYQKAGNVITTTTSVLSEDGKTLMVTARIPLANGKELTNLSVYERP